MPDLHRKDEKNQSKWLILLLMDKAYYIYNTFLVTIFVYCEYSIYKNSCHIIISVIFQVNHFSFRKIYVIFC